MPCLNAAPPQHGRMPPHLHEHALLPQRLKQHPQVGIRHGRTHEWFAQSLLCWRLEEAQYVGAVLTGGRDRRLGAAG